MQSLHYPVLLVAAYLIGSIPFSQIIAALFRPGIRLRETGSENIGATNVFVNAGPLAGFIALLLDMGKGIFVLFLARAWMSWSFSEDLWQILSLSVFVILGHDYPVFTGFKGGKGLAAMEGFLLFFGTAWAVLVHLPQAQFLFHKDRRRAMALANVLVLLMFPLMSLLWHIESLTDIGWLGWDFTRLFGEPVLQHEALSVFSLIWMLMFFMQRVLDTPGLREDVKKGVSFPRAFFIRGLFELFPLESDYRRPDPRMPMGEEALFRKKEKE
ncbi:MAG: glycerol-3-phosphate acyltransferase [Candidatus Marinimicrobia bacterium]|jgi:glycerol-3-phosphate acyltransferase PlsY|nr:glycerol-3-phosphate acyltransferase [Candidatus Neomarinimicrobiota bacterium]MDD4961031.1 glycerol-3-phosphate acyltransferase [Candidatus Neomarinimicrobiota bacterium]MDD5709133.1 glycerol-3-phosphate acyltransferase [Candidatus Neomarinimicrobiota bacterium]MDX9777567.1 glycerol-3-phosphate acyltransferase [bacterium]